MNKIKFSHDYLKFPFNNMGEVPLVLLGAIKTHYNDLGEDLIKYDTAYWADNGDDVEYYPLPKTDLLLLLFATHSLTGNERILFTIRRWTPQKEKFYKDKRGEHYAIERTDKQGER
jgi:hypothetical protein